MTAKKELSQKARERELQARRQAWRAALDRYGADGEGPLRGRSPLRGGEGLARALKALLALGAEQGLPKGADPELAAFVAGKELGRLANRRSRFSPTWSGLLYDIAPEKLEEKGFERLRAFVEGAAASLGGECDGPLFSAWVEGLAREGQAGRLGRLLDAGASCRRRDAGRGDPPPALAAAFEARSKACVETFLRFGADPDDWEDKPEPLGMAFFGSVHGWMGGGGWMEDLKGAAEEAPAELAGRQGARVAPWRLGRGETPAAPGWEKLSARSGEPGALAQAWVLGESVQAIAMADRADRGPRL